MIFAFLTQDKQKIISEYFSKEIKAIEKTGWFASSGRKSAAKRAISNLQAFEPELLAKGLTPDDLLYVRRELESYAAGAAKILIDDLPDRYRLHGVKYNGSLWIVDLSKSLLDGGNKHTQDEWVKVTKETEFKLPDAALYNEVILFIYENIGQADSKQRRLLKKVKELLKQDLEKQQAMTCTRIDYSADGNDLLTHDYGQVLQKRIRATLAGPSGIISTGPLGQAVSLILGTDDLAKIHAAYEKIFGAIPYLFRFNPAIRSPFAAGYQRKHGFSGQVWFSLRSGAMPEESGPDVISVAPPGGAITAEIVAFDVFDDNPPMSSRGFAVKPVKM